MLAPNPQTAVFLDKLDHWHHKQIYLPSCNLYLNFGVQPQMLHWVYETTVEPVSLYSNQWFWTVQRFRSLYLNWIVLFSWHTWGFVVCDRRWWHIVDTKIAAIYSAFLRFDEFTNISEERHYFIPSSSPDVIGWNIIFYSTWTANNEVYIVVERLIYIQ